MRRLARFRYLLGFTFLNLILLGMVPNPVSEYVKQNFSDRRSMQRCGGTVLSAPDLDDATLCQVRKKSAHAAATRASYAAQGIDWLDELWGQSHPDDKCRQGASGGARALPGDCWVSPARAAAAMRRL